MINVTSVFASNIVGILVMVVLFLSKGWRIQSQSLESKILLVMIFSVMLGCIVDPLASFLDGRPGGSVRVLLVFLNTILFMLNIVVGPGYISLIVTHINEKLAGYQKGIIYILCSVELMMLVLNIFFPIVFYIDDNNRYGRLTLYWLYIGAELFLLLYGLWIYFSARRRGRFLKFFPAWQFFIPIIVGMVIQSLMYGVSLVWPCVGVAFCGIAICLQNESIYLDKLTGTYNRFYLDEVLNVVKLRSDGRCAALMLDMNGFKKINDEHSHSEGDRALIAVAGILTKVVKNEGIVIRFAGDEFVILLDKPSTELVVEIRENIAKAIEYYNITSGKPYQLSAAVGGDVFDLKDIEVAEFMNGIDRLMYADKAEYYRIHDRRKNISNRSGENV